MAADIPYKHPLIIGHRGASHDAPENTMEAFRLAVEQGADGIEADFRLTVDGRIVCMHDETTARTTGTKLTIANSRLDQLQRLDAGSWRGSHWAGVVIPTLDEILANLPEDCWFFIEIKCGAEIIEPLTKLLHSSGRSQERIRLLSFSLPLITMIKQRLPEWQTCWTSNYRRNPFNNTWSPSPQKIVSSLKSSAAEGFASADRHALNPELVDTLRKLGREIHVWTVDDPLAAQQRCIPGITSIMTNRPGLLRDKLVLMP